MPFGVVSGIGRGIGVLDRSGDCRRGRGSFRGQCGTSHCYQWNSLCEGRLFPNYFGISCYISSKPWFHNFFFAILLLLLSVS